ncbi:MAG TPA: ABC transporter ATP-binding protein [Chitinophagaceae bacterium]|nr:ABC transporter ATP-binding protein [Chitinophagaceae bacterium]
MADKILEIIDLKREFKTGPETVRALRGISFSVASGEFVSIMGASGSGKSTLLNILGCLDKPTAGDYILDQVNVKDLSRNELARLRNRKIGFVFQSYNLLARTSTLENVELPLLYNPEVSARDRHGKARQVLEAVGLGDRLRHLSNELSGGQQQRVAIARALINDPVMILADEPTGNLDTRSSYSIMSLMQDLNARGVTILCVTHEPDIAVFTGRTIVLRDGRVIRDEKNPRVKSAREALAALPANDEYQNQSA